MCGGFPASTACHAPPPPIYTNFCTRPPPYPPYAVLRHCPELSACRLTLYSGIVRSCPPVALRCTPALFGVVRLSPYAVLRHCPELCACRLTLCFGIVRSCPPVALRCESGIVRSCPPVALRCESGIVRSCPFCPPVGFVRLLSACCPPVVRLLSAFSRVRLLGGIRCRAPCLVRGSRRSERSACQTHSRSAS